MRRGSVGSAPPAVSASVSTSLDSVMAASPAGLADDEWNLFGTTTIAPHLQTTHRNEFAGAVHEE